MADHLQHMTDAQILRLAAELAENGLNDKLIPVLLKTVLFRIERKAHV